MPGQAAIRYYRCRLLQILPFILQPTPATMDWVEILVEAPPEAIPIIRFLNAQSIQNRAIAFMTKTGVKVVIRMVIKTMETLEALIMEGRTVERQQPMTLWVYCCHQILRGKFPGMTLA